MPKSVFISIFALLLLSCATGKQATTSNVFNDSVSIKDTVYTQYDKYIIKWYCDSAASFLLSPLDSGDNKLAKVKGNGAVEISRFHQEQKQIKDSTNVVHINHYISKVREVKDYKGYVIMSVLTLFICLIVGFRKKIGNLFAHLF